MRLSANKPNGDREQLEAPGAWLVLHPGYSPDVNPIERTRVVEAEIVASKGGRTLGNRARALRWAPLESASNPAHGWISRCRFRVPPRRERR